VWLGPLNVDAAFEKKDFEFDYCPNFVDEEEATDLSVADLQSCFLKAFECVFEEYGIFIQSIVFLVFTILPDHCFFPRSRWEDSFMKTFWDEVEDYRRSRLHIATHCSQIQLSDSNSLVRHEAVPSDITRGMTQRAFFV
jgi:hypothetical protein